MGRNRKRKRTSGIPLIPPDFLLSFLKFRALTLSKGKNHDLGEWQSSKKKYGKGSMKSVCRTCARKVVIMPYGPLDVGTKIGRKGRPSMLGETLFEECGSGKPISG